MWRAIGKYLQDARLERKWTPTEVERAGGPTYKTVQAIEDGQVGNVESLDKCALALGLQLPDIVNHVLKARETPLSPEAAHIVKKFNEMTIDGRAVLLQVANVLPLAASPAAARPNPAGRATRRSTPSPRPAPLGAGRRTSE